MTPKIPKTNLSILATTLILKTFRLCIWMPSFMSRMYWIQLSHSEDPAEKEFVAHAQ